MLPILRLPSASWSTHTEIYLMIGTNFLHKVLRPGEGANLGSFDFSFILLPKSAPQTTRLLRPLQVCPGGKHKNYLHYSFRDNCCHLVTDRKPISNGSSIDECGLSSDMIRASRNCPILPGVSKSSVDNFIGVSRLPWTKVFSFSTQTLKWLFQDKWFVTKIGPISTISKSNKT